MRQEATPSGLMGMAALGLVMSPVDGREDAALLAKLLGGDLEGLTPR
jgi:hypothetical protein